MPIAILRSGDDFVAINVSNNGGESIAAMIGINSNLGKTFKAIDLDSNIEYKVEVPDELVNSPIYLVGQDIPLKISTT